jgi:hypothetical protein
VAHGRWLPCRRVRGLWSHNVGDRARARPNDASRAGVRRKRSHVPTADVLLGTHAVRAAYYPTSRWRENVVFLAQVFTSVTASLAASGETNWRDIKEARHAIPSLDRLLVLTQDQDRHNRRVVLDVSTLALSRTSRFYASSRGADHSHFDLSRPCRRRLRFQSPRASLPNRDCCDPQAPSASTERARSCRPAIPTNPNSASVPGPSPTCGLALR